nr:unnamed protein product [Spirometra erinaceieuropaei]
MRSVDAHGGTLSIRRRQVVWSYLPSPLLGWARSVLWPIASGFLSPGLLDANSLIRRINPAQTMQIEAVSTTRCITSELTAPYERCKHFSMSPQTSRIFWAISHLMTPTPS